VSTLSFSIGKFAAGETPSPALPESTAAPLSGPWLFCEKLFQNRSSEIFEERLDSKVFENFRFFENDSSSFGFRRFSFR